MTLTLKQIDDFLTNSAGIRMVGAIEIEESGVDPVGLRQLNLDYMDSLLPGINNVTRFIRVYSYMTWAWWKAGVVAGKEGESNTSVIKDLATRYEILFAWAHALDGAPLTGATTIRRILPMTGDKESFTFSGDRWEQLKDSMTSLMAPTEYGPSIKALRWLMPMEGGIFRPYRETMTAVSVIDQLMSEKVDARLLGFEAPTLHYEDVLPIAKVVRIDSPSSQEKSVFRHLFHGGAVDKNAPPGLIPRSESIDLIRAHMREAGAPISIPDLRRALSKADVPTKSVLSNRDLNPTSVLFSILQARQLQRLATESMLLWLEHSLSDTTASARTTEELADAANSAAWSYDPLVQKATTVDQYMQSIEVLAGDEGWPKAAGSPETDVTGLIEQIRNSQTTMLHALPGLCLKAFAVIHAVTRACAKSDGIERLGNPLNQRPDRLPLAMVSERIAFLGPKPLNDLWCEIIEKWIIAQHVRWSAIRGADGKKRLRICREGQGWIRVRSTPSRRFAPTPDRLFTLLSLGSDCGLFARTSLKSDAQFSNVSD